MGSFIPPMPPSDLDIAPLLEEAPMESPAPEIDEEEMEDIVLDLVREYEEDDRSAHEKISAECRKFELYWQGIQDIIWDSTSNDWVSASGILQTARDLDVDPSMLDKVIGIYRSYGEIVCSALSQTTPAVRFPPSDADSGADMTTARTSNEIAKLIEKHNNAQLLFLRALYTKFNQHFVAAYHCIVTDDAYGTVERPDIGLQDTQVPTGRMVCPDCLQEAPPQEEMGMEGMEGMPPEESMPQEAPPEMGAAPEQAPPEPQPTATGEMPPPPITLPPPAVCQFCGSTREPIEELVTEKTPYVKGILRAPKGRVRIEVYGPRQVKIQPYVKNVEASPYLILETDIHENLIHELYENYEITGISDESDTRKVDRRPTLEIVDTRKIHTLKRCWLRPWAFNSVEDKDIRIALRNKFPKGMHAVIVDKEILEMTPELVDDHWTFCTDPFAEYIHGDPKGKALVPIQDMVNDSEMLSLETILHNIPEMYADTSVVNFKLLSQKEAKPGQMNQAKAPEGQALSSGFFQPQGATLSREVDSFMQRLETWAQFVIGAPPSIFGGAQQGGSGTLGEYQQSRSQAQQRLGTDWKMLNLWWRDIMQKSVDEYRRFIKQLGKTIKDPTYSEKFVKRDGENYSNVWIRLEDLTGEVGEAEAETSDQYPVSYEQQRGLLFEIFNSPNPTLGSLATSPENIGAVRDIIGLYKLKVPGEQDRDKQLYEITLMLEGQQVMAEQFVDNHQAHWQTVSSWCASPTGRDTKLTNPQGYELVMTHAMQHFMVLQQQAEQAAQQAQGSGGQAEAQGSAEAPSTGGAAGEPV